MVYFPLSLKMTGVDVGCELTGPVQEMMYPGVPPLTLGAIDFGSPLQTDVSFNEIVMGVGCFTVKVAIPTQFLESVMVTV